MIAVVRIWYAGLSRREQWLVGTAGGLAALVLLLFGIIMPGLSAIENARLAHDEAVQRRGRIEATVNVVGMQKPNARVSGNQDIEMIVTQGAAEKGFDLIKSAGVAPGQISFRIDQARAPALLAWLNELESQDVMVSSVTLRSGANGSVSVDAQLQKATR